MEVHLTIYVYATQIGAALMGHTVPGPEIEAHMANTKPAHDVFVIHGALPPVLLCDISFEGPIAMYPIVVLYCDWD